MTRALVLLAATAALGTGGCAGPRHLSRTAGEGVVALPENSDVWPARYRSKAMELIVQHVGPDYEIVSEQEVVTGHTVVHDQKTDRQATVNPHLPFLPAEQQQTSTTTRHIPTREWQISYRRRAAAPVVPAAATVPAPN